MKTKSGIIIDRDLIHKYSLRGPRYTSYPTAPEWKPEVGEDQYWNQSRESNQDGSVRPISLYFHIPSAVSAVITAPVMSLLPNMRPSRISMWSSLLMRWNWWQRKFPQPEGKSVSSGWRDPDSPATRISGASVYQYQPIVCL